MNATKNSEILFVLDLMIGQDAFITAIAFNDVLYFDFLIL